MKKILSALFALTIVSAGFTGCGSNNDQSGAENNNNTTTYDTKESIHNPDFNDLDDNSNGVLDDNELRDDTDNIGDGVETVIDEIVTGAEDIVSGAGDIVSDILPDDIHTDESFSESDTSR